MYEFSVIRSVMPLHARQQRAVRGLERLPRCRWSESDSSSRRSVRDDDQRIDLLAQVLDAEFCLVGTLRAFERERPRDHGDGQSPLLVRRAGHDRAGAGTGAATLAAGDEHHVGALEGLPRYPTDGPGRPSCHARDRHRRRSPRFWLSPKEIFTSASERSKSLASVLTATNSTFCRPSAIMRLTALPPAPPTPTTLMLVLSLNSVWAISLTIVSCHSRLRITLSQSA